MFKNEQMQYFRDIKIGQLFTNERKLKNNPHQPTVWRKKSSRAATLAHNPRCWFYFSNTDATFPKGKDNDI